MFIKLTLKKIDLIHKSLFFSQKKRPTHNMLVFFIKTLWLKEE